MKVDGKYYPKDIDITVCKEDKAVFFLVIKFVTSNYKQNVNNYFENMMGETANVQVSGLPYAQLIILRYKTPYYKKNNPDTSSKIETINDKDISKYSKLIFDNPQAHRPQYLGIKLIDINEQTGKVSSTNPATSFSTETASLLKTKLSLETFFKDIESYKNFYMTQNG